MDIKKIKIGIKSIDDKEFTLLEDAKKGDYISLNDLNKISFDELNKNLNQRKTEILDSIWKNEKDKYILNSKEFKLRENEINDLNIQIKSFQIKKEKEIAEIKLQVENENSKKVIELEKTKIELQTQLNSIKNDSESKIKFLKKEFELSSSELKAKIENNNSQKIIELEKINSELQTQLNEKMNSIKIENESKIDLLKKEFELKKNELDSKRELETEKLKQENKSLKEKMESEIQLNILKKEKELKDNFDQKIEQKDTEIKSLNEQVERKNSLNIKELGQELESWIQNEASNSISNLPKVIFEKTNLVTDGTKPDFIFKVLNDDGSILTSVTIEAKSEFLKGNSTKKKNKDHIEKLDQDRKKQTSEYALLITELEKDDEFIFKNVGEYENMYMVRPRYFVPFLMLIYNLAQKQKEITHGVIDFKARQDILNEFNEMKSIIIEKASKNIKSNVDDIIKESEKIIKSAQNAMEKANTISKHITTIDNKIDGFKINKLIDKIDEI